jgi:hypothetical protein
MDPQIRELLFNGLALLLTALVTVLTPVIVMLVRRGVKHLEKMADVQLSEKQLKQIDWAVETAIRYTEEVARKRLAAGQLQPMSGEAKREVAVTAARSLAPDRLHTLSDTQLEDVIDARVNKLRPALFASKYPPPASSPPPATEVPRAPAVPRSYADMLTIAAESSSRKEQER